MASLRRRSLPLSLLGCLFGLQQLDQPEQPDPPSTNSNAQHPSTAAAAAGPGAAGAKEELPGSAFQYGTHSRDADGLPPGHANRIMCYLRTGTLRLRAYAIAELLRLHKYHPGAVEELDQAEIVHLLIGVLSNGTDQGRSRAATLLARLCSNGNVHSTRLGRPGHQSTAGAAVPSRYVSCGSSAPAQASPDQCPSGIQACGSATGEVPTAVASVGDGPPPCATAPLTSGTYSAALQAAISGNAAATLLSSLRSCATVQAQRAALQALASLIRQREVAPQVVACMGHLDLLDCAEGRDVKVARHALLILYYLAADKTHIQEELGYAGAVPRLLRLLSTGSAGCASPSATGCLSPARADCLSANATGCLSPCGAGAGCVSPPAAAADGDGPSVSASAACPPDTVPPAADALTSGLARGLAVFMDRHVIRLSAHVLKALMKSRLCARLADEAGARTVLARVIAVASGATLDACAADPPLLLQQHHLQGTDASAGGAAAAAAPASAFAAAALVPADELAASAPASPGRLHLALELLGDEDLQLAAAVALERMALVLESGRDIFSGRAKNAVQPYEAGLFEPSCAAERRRTASSSVAGGTCGGAAASGTGSRLATSAFEAAAAAAAATAGMEAAALGPDGCAGWSGRAATAVLDAAAAAGACGGAAGEDIDPCKNAQQQQQERQLSSAMTSPYAPAWPQGEGMCGLPVPAVATSSSCNYTPTLPAAETQQQHDATGSGLHASSNTSGAGAGAGAAAGALPLESSQPLTTAPTQQYLSPPAQRCPPAQPQQQPGTHECAGPLVAAAEAGAAAHGASPPVPGSNGSAGLTATPRTMHMDSIQLGSPTMSTPLTHREAAAARGAAAASEAAHAAGAMAMPPLAECAEPGEASTAGGSSVFGLELAVPGFAANAAGGVLVPVRGLCAAAAAASSRASSASSMPYKADQIARTLDWGLAASSSGTAALTCGSSSVAADAAAPAGCVGSFASAGGAAAMLAVEAVPCRHRRTPTVHYAAEDADMNLIGSVTHGMVDEGGDDACALEAGSSDDFWMPTPAALMTVLSSAGAGTVLSSAAGGTAATGIGSSSHPLVRLSVAVPGFGAERQGGVVMEADEEDDDEGRGKADGPDDTRLKRPASVSTAAAAAGPGRRNSVGARGSGGGTAPGRGRRRATTGGRGAAAPAADGFVLVVARAYEQASGASPSAARGAGISSAAGAVAGRMAPPGPGGYARAAVNRIPRAVPHPVAASASTPHAIPPGMRHLQHRAGSSSAKQLGSATPPVALTGQRSLAAASTSGAGSGAGTSGSAAAAAAAALPARPHGSVGTNLHHQRSGAGAASGGGSVGSNGGGGGGGGGSIAPAPGRMQPGKRSLSLASGVQQQHVAAIDGAARSPFAPPAAGRPSMAVAAAPAPARTASTRVARPGPTAASARAAAPPTPGQLSVAVPQMSDLDAALGMPLCSMASAGSSVGHSPNLKRLRGVAALPARPLAVQASLVARRALTPPPCASPADRPLTPRSPLQPARPAPADSVSEQATVEAAAASGGIVAHVAPAAPTADGEDAPHRYKHPANGSPSAAPAVAIPARLVASRHVHAGGSGAHGAADVLVPTPSDSPRTASARGTGGDATGSNVLSRRAGGVLVPTAGGVSPCSSSLWDSTEELLQMASDQLGPFLLQQQDVSVCRDEQGRKLALGEGGFGYVFKGLMNGVDEVAVKVVKKSAPSRRELEAFLAEVRTLSRLRHRNIVQLYGACLQPHALFLVTELMRGGDLYHALRQHPHLLRWEDLGRKVALDMALGLNYLHCQSPPLFHKDIKSPNVLLSEEGVAKIADVGMSHAMVDELASAQPVLTPLWAAPEVVSRERASIKADIWSYGIVLFEIVTGADITRLQPLAISRQMGLADGPRTVAMPESAPPVARRIFEACTQMDPAARPTSAQIVAWLRESAPLG